MKAKVHDGKPPYRVPSMAEVRAVPWNGFTAASTFSGCGGSSLGYRMAGFRVLWASEFIDAARDSYRANMDPRTVLDGRDVREVTPEEVLAACGLEAGELDLLDGSPPCASFSTAGKRQRDWGKVKRYSDKEQRTDDLFFEFVRLLRGIRPRTFVAENVSGLVKGTAKGYFLEILKALKGAGYRVACRVLDAQWLGVPQCRQRTIFVGVREDVLDAQGRPLQPCHPSPLPWRYSVLEAIPWIGGAIGHNRVEEVTDRSSDGPAPSVRAGRPAHLTAEGTKLEIIQQQGAPGIGKKRLDADRPLPTVCGTQTAQFKVQVGANGPFGEESWVDAEAGPAGTIGATPSTGNGRSPSGEVQVSTAMDAPIERRKFTIAELRRICAFPDDFVLTGSYAQQWERLGRAVPPLMMRAIAEAVRDGVLLRAAGARNKPRRTVRRG